ncbi:hypothetical protein GJT93_00900 [Enterobacteriaceae endosymbiont of Donacia provostii]|uniref:hypothetical protein n=1 Tax=Enterobacteriaceae endosymbiont of Donacia provostii TaxID=2675781 RepID=UPI001448CD2E|nr:hypothetical protein [Enterobacteriaceae endosymbiont of Donacia provostii]QJC33668.1 hypothetical protein GJT93_00900 [Enterobacteriaceae endosymbiont of Donacia provostii]
MNTKKNINLLNYVELNNLQILTIKGSDSKIFLQNQLTININKLDNSMHFFNAFHCNSQGKVLTNMHIFKICENNYQCIIRKNILQKYLENIKKYLLLYKVKISLNKERKIFGILNIQKDQIIYKNFKNKNISLKKRTVYFFQKNIFLKFKYMKKYNFLILSKENIFFILKNFFIFENLYLKNSIYWDKFYMKIGYHIIDMNSHCNLFFPQQFCINKIHAIDFHKGCYLGQEIINSLIFKKKINQKLFLLEVQSNMILSYNNLLEFKDNESKKWRIIRSQIILKILNIKSNLFWIQVLLKNNFIKKNLIRFQKYKENNIYINKIF